LGRMARLCSLLFVLVLPVLPHPLVACDTWVALSGATRNGRVMLAKNSDRLAFDCQPLELNPAQEWPPGSRIDLGRLTVPQVARTYATLGSSPYWCWGYEEGINEFGVAIGNEGVATKPLLDNVLSAQTGRAPEPGPTGMDLIRLGLERSRTAQEAVEVIAGLVETFGQFGSGMPARGPAASYDNSFMIADPDEAWILETAGRKWAAKKVEMSGSISNGLTIGTDWDLASPDLVDYAESMGWWPAGDETTFDFRSAYSPDVPAAEEGIERARIRRDRSSALLDERTGDVDLGWMKRIARDRATEPAIDMDETASACVAQLTGGKGAIPILWWCAGRPGNGCYVPFFVGGGHLPEIVTRAGTYGKRVVPPSEAEPDSFDAGSYWWLFRDLSDMVAADWDGRHPVVREEFDRLEAEFERDLEDVLAEAAPLKTAGKDEAAAVLLDEYTSLCVEKAVASVNDLRSRFRDQAVEIPAKYRPYVGTYTGNFGPFRDAAFEVRVENGRLAVDVPGQMVFEMKEPDDKGLWYFALTDLVAVSFVAPGGEKATAMRFHQTTRIPREEAPSAAPPEGVPEAYRPLVGRYVTVPGAGGIEVVAAGGHLALEIPGEPRIELLEPDDEGRWYFTGDPTTSVSFELDESGNATRLDLHQTFELPRAD
jgi:secernin